MNLPDKDALEACRRAFDKWRSGETAYQAKVLARRMLPDFQPSPVPDTLKELVESSGDPAGGSESPATRRSPTGGATACPRQQSQQDAQPERVLGTVRVDPLVTLIRCGCGYVTYLAPGLAPECAHCGNPLEAL